MNTCSTSHEHRYIQHLSLHMADDDYNYYDCTLAGTHNTVTDDESLHQQSEGGGGGGYPLRWKL